jgi:predicted dehydrogenase
VVECSYASPIHPDPFPQLVLQIEGTRGSLRVDPGYRMTVAAGGDVREADVSPALFPWSTPPWHGVQESVVRTQEHWVKCLREGIEPETSGADSLKTYGLVWGAYESARTGQAVTPLEQR